MIRKPNAKQGTKFGENSTPQHNPDRAPRQKTPVVVGSTQRRDSSASAGNADDDRRNYVLGYN